MPKQTKLSPIWDYYTETDDPKYAQILFGVLFHEKSRQNANSI